MIRKLRHRITLQSLTRGDDGMGGGSGSGTWSNVKSMWAEIKPMSAQQAWHAERLNHRVTHKITVRYDSAVTFEVEQRIKHGTRFFYIRSFRDLDERERFVEIMAEEGAPS